MSVSLIFNAWHKRGFRFQKQKQIKSQRGVVVRHPSTPLLSYVSVQCSRPLTYPLFHVQRQQPVLGVKHMTSSCDVILWSETTSSKSWKELCCYLSHFTSWVANHKTLTWGIRNGDEASCWFTCTRVGGVGLLVAKAPSSFERKNFFLYYASGNFHRTLVPAFKSTIFASGGGVCVYFVYDECVGRAPTLENESAAPISASLFLGCQMFSACFLLQRADWTGRKTNGLLYFFGNWTGGKSKRNNSTLLPCDWPLPCDE